jgi:hypothetical protein
MESWPIRSRAFMSGVLQGAWGIGFLLSSAAYGLLYTSIGWASPPITRSTECSRHICKKICI